MFRRIAAAAAVLAIATPLTISAQSPRVEAAVFGGWTFADGVSTDSVVAAGDGNIYDRVDPKDSASWGFSVAALATESVELGFMYDQQFSTLQIGGTADRDIGDLSITGYHGYFGYNFGTADQTVRPFVFGGFGATNFGSVDFSVPGIAGSTESNTQFSTVWGGGVKLYPAPHFGVRLALRMTPTYIKTDSVGWWCDPYWGCYLAGSAQYANQFDFSGGVTVRF